MYGKSELKFKNTDLKSKNIYVDFNSSNVEAVGPETDSSKANKEGHPVLKEGTETYTGDNIKYNFKTTQGFITAAGTETDGSYYTGEKIKKVDPTTYFIEDGIYTTCDHNPPHFYFYSPKMKVIQNEQIIARWIWLYFGGVPFPIPLPFAVFPIQSGRRSGIIAPVIGDDQRYGNYISHFGYFWAINDYMDANLTADYYTRGSFAVSSRFRYVKRYDYSGNIEAGYKYFRNGDPSDPDVSESTDWRLYWSHHQNITPTLRFDANLQFLSSNYLSRTSIDLSQVLQNNIYSNATLFKNWEESGNSMSISYSRSQDLEKGNVSEVLPNLSFNKSQSYPFKSDFNSGDQKWYELFGYNYSGQFQNRRNKVNGEVTSNAGVLHTISGGLSPKLGHISLSPNFNYQEKWYNKSIEKIDYGPGYSGSDSVVTNDITGFKFVRTFSLGINASTRLYGIVNPHILGIASIRHTFSPSISYNYQPDFSRPGWGYYGRYYDSNGKEVTYDKFANSVYGGAPSGERQSISLSLGNLFEMKTEVDPTDTTSKEKKIQLLNLNAGISYNFAADSLKFSDINVSYRTQVGSALDISGSSTFTLYDYEKNVGKVDRFLINEGKGLARLTSFNFSLSTHLSGERSVSGDDVVSVDTSIQKGEFDLIQESNAMSKGIYGETEADFSIPWDISLNYNYSVSKPTPYNTFKSSNISANLNFNLTKYWKISLTGSYDFIVNEFIAPQVRISRDLHAWILNFTWNPVGLYTGYMLEIRVKAPQLSDLKITKRDQFFSGR
ncbi:MAG TPA: putative LPS assembly protein LptD [Ignavibacteriaceae bacterium]|nr:putative LPS assembly protein LptD [Ignavibacteriaceae bacterium]